MWRQGNWRGQKKFMLIEGRMDRSKQAGCRWGCGGGGVICYVRAVWGRNRRWQGHLQSRDCQAIHCHLGNQECRPLLSNHVGNAGCHLAQAISAVCRQCLMVLRDWYTGILLLFSFFFLLSFFFFKNTPHPPPSSSQPSALTLPLL